MFHLSDWTDPIFPMARLIFAYYSNRNVASFRSERTYLSYGKADFRLIFQTECFILLIGKNLSLLWQSLISPRFFNRNVSSFRSERTNLSYGKASFLVFFQSECFNFRIGKTHLFYDKAVFLLEYTNLIPDF